MTVIDLDSLHFQGPAAATHQVARCRPRRQSR